MNVVVVPHDPNWFAKFSRESIAVLRALGDTVLAVHHVGSTSVAGIYAKPIVDMLVEVRQLGSVDARNEAMADLGYEAMGECGIPGRRYFRKNNALGEREFNVHLFAEGSAAIERHLAFRDSLRAHKDLAAEYSELKRRLARQHPDSIDLYMDGKDAFVKEMERQAVAWRRSAQLSPAREVTEAFAAERSR
jgi:GrpB-like predicted nucleotidyltransferase (UPF0157 family)